ncbi:hypothetical protein I5535_19515 [Rhodobacteraceae bacterium F11138]|nr:hypothetical protein [Rhodobacteraceae bacterium F11138]
MTRTGPGLRTIQRAIQRVLDLAWWHWPIETILAHETAICGADLAEPERAALSVGQPRPAP